MGSLMAGWNSSRTKKKFERNLSLTREEIEHYWRGKKAEQGVQDTGSPSSPQEVKKNIQKSSTFSNQEDEHLRFLPLASHKEILRSKTFNGRETQVEIQSDIAVGSAPTPAWWTKTDLAFLNERPVLEPLEGARFRYTPQFNITGKIKVAESSSNPGPTMVF